MIGYRRRNAEAAQNTDADGSTKQPPVLIGFRAVYVFDVAQTEGEDLPEFEHNITGEVGRKRELLIDFLAQQNIALEFNERIAPALGVSYGGKIAFLLGQTKPEEFVTLVHETAHELLHKAERRTFTTATVRETEPAAKMRPLLRSFIVSSMNSRNRHRFWSWLFCALLFWLHLRKKGRRTSAPRSQGTCSRQNWLKFAQLPCTVPTQPNIGMLCA
ncbi:MAG: hypothetical protein WBP90_11900, partial [Terracidiphilus sp.]